MGYDIFSFNIYGICVEEEKLKKAMEKKGLIPNEMTEDSDFSDDDVIIEYYERAARAFEYIKEFEDKKNKVHRRYRSSNITEEMVKKEIEFNKDNFFFKTGLEVYRINEDEDVYIGISWEEMKENETKVQFKERIEKIIAGIFGKKIKCYSYKEEWEPY